MNPPYQVILGGRILDTEQRTTDHADIEIMRDRGASDATR